MEAAIGVVFQFTDILSADGIEETLKRGSLRDLAVEANLRVVRHDAAVAEALGLHIASLVREVFLSRCVTAFGEECCGYHRRDERRRVSGALHTLSTRFEQATMLLKFCGTQLFDPSMVAHEDGMGAMLRVAVRCALLHDDQLLRASHTPPTDGDDAAVVPTAKDCLLAHLREHGQTLLAMLEYDAVAGDAALKTDLTLNALQSLGLSQAEEVSATWRVLLHEAITSKLAVLEDDDGTQPRIHQCVQWKEHVIDAFVRGTLGVDKVVSSSPHRHANSAEFNMRTEVDRWCAELEQHLMLTFCRKRIERFWDLMIDYPSSIPALQDVRYCLVRSAGREMLCELIAHAKATLANRLHRAGTSTDDILAVLVSAIRALCVVLHKNEQSSGVFAVVGDTLRHLRDRKDSVSAVVKDITQQDNENSILYSDMCTAQQVASTSAGAEEEDSDEDSGSAPAFGSAVSGRRPDVLRVLLSTLRVQSIIDEFRGVLAQRLLAKPAHDYDTTEEDEILERIKCVFGEDLLAGCVVMVKDIQASRRLNQRINSQSRSSSALSGRSSVDPKVSATILSTTCWPKLNTLTQVPAEPPLPQLQYQPHPLLKGYMTQYATQFRQLKPNQELQWLQDLGRVSLRLSQTNQSTGAPTPVSHELGLLAASMALYLKEGPLTVEALAAKVQCAPGLALQRLQQHHPVVFLVRPDGQLVSLQPAVVSASTFAFEEEASQPSAALQAGVSQEELAMIQNTVTAMLKARAASKTAPEILNSLKMFIKYTGSLADLKRVLQFLVSEGKLATTDGATYSLPKAA